MFIKQSAYRKIMGPKGAKAEEYPIPDPLKDPGLFGLYTAFYKLPWDIFVRDYEKFHKDPRGYKNALAGGEELGTTDIPASDDDDALPPPADMAKKTTGKGLSLSNQALSLRAP